MSTNARAYAPTVQPFPFEALPAFSREEMHATRRLRDAASVLVRKEKVAEAMSELVGEPISIILRRARPLDPTRIPPDALGVAIGPTDAPGMSRAILVDVESALANALVTRALRQRAPQVSDASRAPPSADVAGAIAALLHATLRRAHGDVALRVVAAGPAQALARDLASAHRGDFVTAWLSIVVGNDAFDARVSVALDFVPKEQSSSFSLDGLHALSDAPIAMPLLVATCLSTRAELLSLRVGDAFLVPAFPLKSANGAGQLIGPVAIVAASSERGLPGDLAENGRLVLRTERIVNHPWDRRSILAENITGPKNLDPTTMAADNNNVTLETVLEDAPIVVRVELGAVEMKAREWASLSAGDVVTLGRKLGDPAILRVGGVEVARGELVQIDGEYGVRILKGAGT